MGQSLTNVVASCDPGARVGVRDLVDAVARRREVLENLPWRLRTMRLRFARLALAILPLDEVLGIDLATLYHLARDRIHF